MSSLHTSNPCSLTCRIDFSLLPSALAFHKLCMAGTDSCGSGTEASPPWCSAAASGGPARAPCHSDRARRTVGPCTLDRLGMMDWCNEGSGNVCTASTARALQHGVNRSRRRRPLAAPHRCCTLAWPHPAAQLCGTWRSLFGSLLASSNLHMSTLCSLPCRTDSSLLLSALPFRKIYMVGTDSSGSGAEASPPRCVAAAWD